MRYVALRAEGAVCTAYPPLVRRFRDAVMQASVGSSLSPSKTARQRCYLIG
ncbi:MAG: hypothetical protein RLZZ450_7202 [Pseudomonadota bacterium]|jgi:hypothetical protein